MREAAAAVICDEQHVFNAHAALARDVDARLVGDDHARLTDGLIGYGVSMMSRAILSTSQQRMPGCAPSITASCAFKTVL